MINENEDLIERKKLAELKGNLLLTFKTQIKKGASEVELQNIFSESSEKIKIKLNPSKDIAANAAKYFNKFKNISKHRELLAIKKNTISRDLKETADIENRLAHAKSFTQLKKFEQILLDMKLLQYSEKKTSAASLKYSFNRLVLEDEWEVFIGRNAVNNDLLTFKFANKWDIWLHAQGVSGSHVIIRVPGRGQNPPQKIIEQAARLAAANSRAKHSASVPVIFTQVRFVSRLRKAQPGTVTVRNEKVLFVNPLIQ
jgi:predicted ribosome quality control (RQC) complex YloA/Tae2 family protein